MRNFIAIAIGLILFSCVKEIDSLSDLNSDFYEIQNRSIRMNDTLKVNFGSHLDKIDSISLLLNGKKVPNPVVLNFQNAELGINSLEVNVYTKDGRVNGKTKLPLLSEREEKAVEFEIINEYPHPQALFTQGFFYHKGRIYESSGQYNKSKIVAYQLGSNEFLQEVKNDERVFAEGCALLNDKIYQLTYRERQILVYHAPSLELIEKLQMPTELREGWGLTSNGQELIAGDGSHQLYFFDEQFNLKRKIQVVGNVSIYDQINELEYINGKIFANVWQTPYILVIEPENGRVEHYYDLSPLLEEGGTDDDVLNGIAFYNGNLLVTGKKRSNIYEVNLPE